MARREGPRERADREAALRAVTALSTRDQIEVTLTLVKYLGGRDLVDESAVHRRLRLRDEALRDLERSARALGLAAEEAPTVGQHDAQVQALGLMSSQQIIRAFGRWSNAKRALRGERLPETPEQRALRSATTGKERSHEDYFDGVRLWLESDPESLTSVNYDAFVRSRNSDLDPGEKPLVLFGSIQTAIGFTWNDVLAVARGEAEAIHLVEARRERIRRDAGELGLIGTAAVTFLLGEVATALPRLSKAPGFPVAVARVAGTKAWLLDDVEAYGAKGSAPKRHEGEMQDQLMESAELAALLGIQLNSLHAQVHQERWNSVPAPGASVSNKHVWRRSEVDAWFRGRGGIPRDP